MLKIDLHTHSIASGHALSTVCEIGKIDLDGDLLAKQKVVIAGLHARTPYRNNNLKSNTLALVAAMQNPLVQIISHPYRTDFPVDIERVFQEAYKTQTLLELNNQVFARQSSQEGFLETYKRLIDLSKKYGHPLIAGSDAHVANKIGEDSSIVAAYGQIVLTPDMLLNNHPEELTKWKKK